MNKSDLTGMIWMRWIWTQRRIATMYQLIAGCSGQSFTIQLIEEIYSYSLWLVNVEAKESDPLYLICAVRGFKFSQKYYRESFWRGFIIFSIELVEAELEGVSGRLLVPQNTNLLITHAVRDKPRDAQPARKINANREFLLAYIQHSPVAKDRRLLYRARTGVLKVIFASDIDELIGLLKEGKRGYVVRRYSSLFDK